MGWSLQNALHAAWKVGAPGGVPGLVIFGPLGFAIGGFMKKEQIDAVYTGSSDTANDYVYNTVMSNMPDVSIFLY